MPRIFRRGGVYYAWVPKPGGGTQKRTTHCTDREAALIRAAELEREAVDPEGAAAAKATLADALELLIRDRASKVKAGKKSAATVEFYQKKSGVLLDGLAAVLRRSPSAPIYLREVKARVVDDYIVQRRDDGARESTIHKELTTWRAAMRIAKRREIWRGDIDAVFPKGFSPEYEPKGRYVAPHEIPLLHRAIVRPQATTRHSLSPTQLDSLRARYAMGENRKALAAAFSISTATVWSLCAREQSAPPVIGHGLFALVAYAIATGAEPAAVWRARRSDAAPDLSMCRVHGSKNKHRRGEKGKGRPVPLPLLGFRWLLAYALKYAPGDDLLFPASMQHTVRRELAAACERAGIETITLTDCRRTHGKWLRLSGVAPSAIGPSLGHADSRMADLVYGRATADELAAVQIGQIEAAGGGLLMGGTAGKTEQ